MADFLNEFVKTVMDETIQTDYPHIRHPALLYAQVKEIMSQGGQSCVTLQVLTEMKEPDDRFPLLPCVRTGFDLQAGETVIIGLLYGGCVPYIFGRCLDDSK